MPNIQIYSAIEINLAFFPGSLNIRSWKACKCPIISLWLGAYFLLKYFPLKLTRSYFIANHISLKLNCNASSFFVLKRQL